jgi:hypothetical protein
MCVARRPRADPLRVVAGLVVLVILLAELIAERDEPGVVAV